jgi:hypothetical protein
VTEAANAEVRRLMSADLIRNAIEDELEEEPRYFTRAIERVVDAHIDVDSISDNIKEQVLDDIDLDGVVGDKLIEHLDDDDNLRSITRRVVESISISITPSI